MKTLRQLTILMLVCALGVSCLAGCSKKEPTPSDGDTTTTTLLDSTTTDTGSSSDATSSQTTVKPSDSANPSQGSTSTVKPTSADSQTPAEIYGIFIDGTPLSGFTVKTKNYTHYLAAGTKSAPTVTAAKTAGSGEVTIVQASTPNGIAKVTLNGVTYNIQFSVRRSEMELLNNTYYQLKTANKLNIAYLGGSVTDGHGSSNRSKSWRALTTQCLKSQYPSATINETNAGIGGTGSIYGAHRVIQDLKLTSATEKPDLVFIEFASNDNSDKAFNTTPDVYMESIVQTIYKYAPQADIVMVFITSYYTKDTEFEAKKAHKKIAEAYQIPYIDVGARLWQEIVKENGGSAPSGTSDTVWTKYFTDIIHPTDAGYAKYAQYVKEYLSGILSKKTATPSGRVNAFLPSKTVTTLPVAPYIDNLKGLTPTDSRLTVDDNGYIKSNQAGASFTFKFTGRDLKFWICGSSSTPSNGKFKVDIDNKTQYIDFSATNHKVIPIASGLSSGEHTVTVTLRAASESGAVLDLRYFLISGDKNMSGVTLVK